MRLPMLLEAEEVKVTRTESPMDDVKYSFISSSSHHKDCKHTVIRASTGSAQATMEHCPSRKWLHLHTIDSESESPVHAHKALGSWFKEAVSRPHDVQWVSADQQNPHAERFIKNMGARKISSDRYLVRADVMRSPKYRRLSA